MARIGVLLAFGLLAACNKGAGSAPTGQVVANVAGQEITASELNLEMAGVPRPTDQKAQKALEAAALRSIVARKLTAAAAREQKLDATPEFAMQRSRTEDYALINALETKLAAAVPAPSQEEAERFVAEHPDSFAQRKIFLVDQLGVPNAPPAVVKAMEPLKTLPAIAALLESRKVPFQRASGAVDALATDAAMVQRIAALPPGEPFVITNGGGVVVNQVRGTRVEPITGPQAITAAQAMLKQQRTQQIVGRQLAKIVADGEKSVTYNAAYTPPKTPATPAAK